MWDIVRGLVADGITIFLTTQYLEEADELAGRIALLDDGHIVAEGTPSELKRLVPGGHIRLEFGQPAHLEQAAERLGDVRRDPDALALDVPTDGEVASLRAVLDRLAAASVEVAGVSIHTPDLDDVFLSLTGKNSPRKVVTP
jgi:ABC-2 type transport system ATP-binding protein